MARYEHRLQYDDTLSGSAGVNYYHRDYDGVGENDVSLTMNISERF
jgi:hypothetical protein